jgi:hypothetical protein
MMTDSTPPSPVEGGISDQRARFERLSRQSERDEEAERSFVEHKIEIARSDPNLTEEQRRAAVEELTRQLPDVDE